METVGYGVYSPPLTMFPQIPGTYFSLEAHSVTLEHRQNHVLKEKFSHPVLPAEATTFSQPRFLHSVPNNILGDLGRCFVEIHTHCQSLGWKKSY